MTPFGQEHCLWNCFEEKFLCFDNTHLPVWENPILTEVLQNLKANKSALHHQPTDLQSKPNKKKVL